jgi:transcriptional regulator with XRE-family HTH domain
MTGASALREARERSGLSVRALAARAEVAASTIWRIESGRLDPTVGMLQRLVNATGDGAAPATREAMVGLAIGRVTAAELLRQPDRILDRAKGRVDSLLGRSDLPRASRRWLEEWDRILAGPLEAVVAALLDPSQRGYELRQHTPFTGVLAEDDRLAAIREATRRHRAARSA